MGKLTGSPEAMERGVATPNPSTMTPYIKRFPAVDASYISQCVAVPHAAAAVPKSMMALLEVVPLVPELVPDVLPSALVAAQAVVDLATDTRANPLPLSSVPPAEGVGVVLTKVMYRVRRSEGHTTMEPVHQFIA